MLLPFLNEQHAPALLQRMRKEVRPYCWIAEINPYKHRERQNASSKFLQILIFQRKAYGWVSNLYRNKIKKSNFCLFWERKLGLFKWWQQFQEPSPVW